VLEWEPGISLEDGLAETYGWIEANVRQVLDAQGAETGQRVLQEVTV
jgi:hypothetical protein